MRLAANLAIDLKLLKSNIQILQTLASKTAILFMVKANGYGHGLAWVAQTLAEAGQADSEIAELLKTLQ